MKFSKQLYASADLRYLQAYIAYKDLKKAIKLITGEDVECCTVWDVVSNFGGTSALTGSIFRPPESRFQDLLNVELEKINEFSRKKACDILTALDDAYSRLRSLRDSLPQRSASAVSDAAAAASEAAGGAASAVTDTDPATATHASRERDASLAAADQSLSASGTPVSSQQPRAAEDVFHSPAASEGSSNITGRGRINNEDARANSKEGRRSSLGGDSEKSSSLGGTRRSTISTSRLGSSDKNGNGIACGSSAALNGVHGGTGRSIFESSGGDKNERRTDEEGDLHAREVQERAVAAELLRVQQQLMELEGILEEQSGEIIFLDSYVRLNFTGFRKITKKYDKHNRSAAASWYMHRVVKQDFMRLNFSLLLARLATSYEALAQATHVYRQQQTHTFDTLLEKGTNYPQSAWDTNTRTNGTNRHRTGPESYSGREARDKCSPRQGDEDPSNSPRKDGLLLEVRGSSPREEEGSKNDSEMKMPAPLERKLSAEEHAEASRRSSRRTPAENQWTPLQRAAESECSTSDQHVGCFKYLVPPDMIMRVKVTITQQYSLLSIHGLPVSLFAPKYEGGGLRQQTTSSAVSETGDAAGSAAGTAAGRPSRPSVGKSSSVSVDKKHSRGDSVTGEGPMEIHRRSSPVLQLTTTTPTSTTNRSRSHRNSSALLDAAGGAAARAASWHVHLDSPSLQLYTAALAGSEPPADFAGLFAPADDSLLLLPRIRWHGQSTSLASPLSRVALELCRVDESSASRQEDIATTCESNLPQKGCPPLTVILQQRQLQELLRGGISSQDLLQQLLSEEGQEDWKKVTSGTGDLTTDIAGSAGNRTSEGVKDTQHERDGPVSTAEQRGISTAEDRITVPPGAATNADTDALVADISGNRTQQMRRVLDFVSAAVRRQRIAPTLRARFYRTQFRSSNGLISLSLDEDIRFSRELGKPIPSSQWIRSETEALTTDDVQPFPWGVLDVSFLMQREQNMQEGDEHSGVKTSAGNTQASSEGVVAASQQQQQATALSNRQLAFDGSISSVAFPDGSLQPPAALESNACLDAAHEDLQDLLAKISSLPNVVHVPGFSLFLHGVATLYTERLQEMHAMQQQKQKPKHGGEEGVQQQQQEIRFPPMQREVGRSAQGMGGQRAGEAAGTQQPMSESSESLLPHWLQYTLAMERQDDNELPSSYSHEQTKAAQGGSREIHGVADGKGAPPQVFAAGTRIASKSDTNDLRREAPMIRSGRNRSSKIDVVHKGTSASLVHEWQATLEEEQPSAAETSFLDAAPLPDVRDRLSVAGPPEGPLYRPAQQYLERRSEAAAYTYGSNVHGAEGRGGTRGRLASSLLTPRGIEVEDAGHPTPHPHAGGLRQPLLLQTGEDNTFGEQETLHGNNRRSRVEGDAHPTATWIQKCGRHWLRFCTKKVCACCFPWTRRRSARRFQQLRTGGGPTGVGSTTAGGGFDTSTAASVTASTVRVEPKTFFANERTLLQWMNTAVLIATIAITLMNFGSPIGRIAGLVMSPVAVFFIGYSFWVYLRRARALERKEPIDYNDKLGPAVLVVTLMCALTVVILLNVLYGGEEAPPPTAPEASMSASDSSEQVAHTKSHSKYMRMSPVAAPLSHSGDAYYDDKEVRDEPQPTTPSTHASGRSSSSSSKKNLLREAAAFYLSAAAPSAAYHTPRKNRNSEATE